ncbi:hypothetical protein CK203_106469 [Vitis vinifera]|uniref:Uncharacterized protein n=1 Tax=Vitis vinifera TaxID=29760 RepID=A0A438CHW0_VITVI|nr:hypothetical protein CK203_106469 [Vitis vinifera]
MDFRIGKAFQDLKEAMTQAPVEYRKGAENLVVDALSIKEEKVELVAISTPIPRWLDTIKEEALTNSKLQHLVKLVQEGE